MTAKLINIGRGHVTQVMEVGSIKEALKEARSHLLSKNVHLCQSAQNHYQLFAGCHAVGNIEIL